MPALPAAAILLFDGYAEEPEPRVNRTPMEDGMAKQAASASRVLVARPMRLLFKTKADYNAFLAFYNTDISRAGWFDFTDPRDGLVKQARFAGGRIAARPTRKDMERWIVECTIETWGH